MEIPDLNHTLLLTIAVLVSLTRLVRLVFLVLRVCVTEYCEFRKWLRAYGRRARHLRSSASSAQAGPVLHAQPGGDEREHEIRPAGSRPGAPTAVRR
jgi:hypothetical protein